jgi:hypothetical protein
MKKTMFWKSLCENDAREKMFLGVSQHLENNDHVYAEAKPHALAFSQIHEPALRIAFCS